MKYFLFIFFLFSIVTTSAQINLKWKTIAPGVWSATAGKPDSFNFYTVTGIHPKTEALAAMPEVHFPLSKNEIKASIVDGKTYLRFPLDTTEKIFGLVLHF